MANATENELVVGKRTFRDLDELREYVLELLDTRGNVFSGSELRSIQELANRANDGAPPEVARIAAATGAGQLVEMVQRVEPG